MYGTQVDIIDSGGLIINPQSQPLEDILPNGVKSTTFSISAPPTITVGNKIVKYRIRYSDFMGTTREEYKEVAIPVTKMTTLVSVSSITEVEIGQTLVVTARLVDTNGNSIGGKTINFYMGSTLIGSSVTDAYGTAFLSYLVRLEAGTYQLSAIFSGSPDFEASSGTINIRVKGLILLIRTPYPNMAIVSVNGLMLTSNSAGLIAYDVASAGVYRIEVKGPVQVSSGKRGLFLAWSDGSTSNPKDVTLTSNTEITVQFKTQYYIDVRSDYGEPTGGGWYDAATIAQVSVRPLVEYINLTRRIFVSWSGDVISTSPSLGIIVDAPKLLIASWRKDYYLSVSSNDVSVGGSGWYQIGETASLSVLNVPEETPKIRRLILTSYSIDIATTVLPIRNPTGNFTINVSMNSPHTLRFTYATQYFLAVEGGNNVKYVGSQTSDSWYDAGSVATITSDYVRDIIEQKERISLTAWSLDDNPRTGIQRKGSGQFASDQLVMNRAHTIKLYSVKQYYLLVSGGDSVTYTNSSLTADNWFDESTSTKISTQYVWGITTKSSRNSLISYELDGLEQNVQRSGDGKFTTSEIVFTSPHRLVFKSVIQYYLDITGGSAIRYSVESPTPDNWWDSGQATVVSTEYAWNIIPNRSRTSLVSFTQDGELKMLSRQSSGRLSTPTIVFDRPHSLTFNSITQFFLQVQGGGGIRFTEPSQTGDSWYDNSSKTQATTDNVWDLEPNRRRKLLVSWRLDDSQETFIERSEEGSFTTATIVMNGDHKVFFNHILQYYIDIRSSYGRVKGQGWKDESEVTSISVDSVGEHGNGTRHAFVRWSGNLSTSENPVNVRISGPLLIVAQWKTQYLVRVDSDFGQPRGSGWYDTGSVVTPQIEPIIDYGNQTREKHIGWTGEITSNDLRPDIIVQKPLSIIATWQREYRMNVAFEDSKGRTLEAASYFLNFKNGTTTSLILKAIWIDRGNSFTITRIAWMGVDVKPENMAEVIIDGPRRLMYKTKVYDATIRITDLLGIPVSDSSVEIRFVNGSTTRLNAEDGIIELRMIPLGRYEAKVSSPLGQTTSIIGDATKEEIVEAKVVLSIPMAWVFGGVAAVVFTVLVVRRFRRHP